jgi:hypothetical protein
VPVVIAFSLGPTAEWTVPASMQCRKRQYHGLDPKEGLA